ncbi:MAG TPA: hypothetical protein VGE76_10395, partial [Opitutaceae bacterium]
MRRLLAPVFLALSLACAAVAPAATSPQDALVQQIVNSANYKNAVSVFDRDFEKFVNELITLTEIPAPPFREQLRAEAYAKLLREYGLDDVTIDAEGNAMGL